MLFLLDFIFSATTVLGVVDREINESDKCARLFSHFEKKYKLPKDILHSISLQESQKAHSKYKLGIVWPWTINVEGKGYYFKSKYDAINFTKKQIELGINSIDVGCMQINLKYHPNAFESLHQAFSPIKNIEYAAQLLRNHYENHGNWHVAVGYYHSATADKASNYRNHVKKINNKMKAYRENLAQYSSLQFKTNTRILASNMSVIKAKGTNKNSNGINISNIKTHDLFRRVQ